jgi:competence protein ComEC
MLAHRAWAGLDPVIGPFEGQAVVITDPIRAFGATRLTVELDGKRYEAAAYGRPGRRLSHRLAGERVVVLAQRRSLDARRAAYGVSRHVVGRADIEFAGDWSHGPVVYQLANRVRRAAERGLDDAPPDVRSLVLGIALGDDRAQSSALRQRFRDAGLSHLTAVSGQNVAFLLALARPLLLRLSLRPRWLATIALIGWFAVLTRFEPSVCRAAMMAGVAATGDLLGRSADSRRALAMTVTLLVLIDPLLIRSYGFWLSVSATTGIVILGPALRGRLRGPPWLREVLAMTVSAQLGVAPVAALLFGGEPLGALPANVLAEPAAALVMTWGLPGALLGSVLPSWLSATLQAPTVGAARWIDLVAARTATLDIPSLRPYAWLGHAVLAAVIVIGGRRPGSRAAP